MQDKRVVFKNKKIRRKLYNNEWWFSVVDVVAALTDRVDPKQYIKRVRQHDSELNSYWGTICTPPLELLARDGKKRKINCADTEGLFRIIQSIPSPKTEPFKRWLAKVGYDWHPGKVAALIGDARKLRRKNPAGYGGEMTKDVFPSNYMSIS